VNKTLWTQVEDALDARLDPFDLPELREALAEDPETQRAVRRLMGSLESLRADPLPLAAGAGPRRSRRWSWLAAAAALLLLAALARTTWLRQGDSLDPDQPARRVETVSLVLQHSSPPPARGARVVLDSRPVVTWTLEGDSR